MILMMYHALFVIFEKAANLNLSTAAIIGGALRANNNIKLHVAQRV